MTGAFVHHINNYLAWIPISSGDILEERFAKHQNIVGFTAVEQTGIEMVRAFVCHMHFVLGWSRLDQFY